ncbi:hypothetical protein QBC36DRAFT_35849 [Triangularia setosa]|uniref:Uncharacterized protein n=1 Tax=Triangularia setosa TaxID=2587417 RepID=A0AAN6W5G9_9PEZI|nr:hypothetical protein QBC36DRAFT_35849 [Podospora setosa]
MCSNMDVGYSPVGAQKELRLKGCVHVSRSQRKLSKTGSSQEGSRHGRTGARNRYFCTFIFSHLEPHQDPGIPVPSTLGNKLCASPSRSVFPTVLWWCVDLGDGELSPREICRLDRALTYMVWNMLNGGGRRFNIVISRMQVNSEQCELVSSTIAASPMLAYRTRFSELAAETPLTYRRAIENGTGELWGYLCFCISIDDQFAISSSLLNLVLFSL